MLEEKEEDEYEYNTQETSNPNSCYDKLGFFIMSEYSQSVCLIAIITYDYVWIKPVCIIDSHN